jgi:Domain of unknown function (DUF1844)
MRRNLGYGRLPGRQVLKVFEVAMNPAVPDASLTALMHLLAEQALMSMGVPHPMMKEVPPANPVVARFYVDLLNVLREKTEGARSESETAQLDEILYQLRMRVMDLKPAVEPPGTAKGQV